MQNKHNCYHCIKEQEKQTNQTPEHIAKFPPTVQYGSFWPKQCYLLPASVPHLSVHSGADQIQTVFFLIDNFLLTMNPNKRHREWDTSRKNPVWMALFYFSPSGSKSTLLLLADTFTNRRQWPACFSAKNAQWSSLSGTIRFAPLF